MVTLIVVLVLLAALILTVIVIYNKLVKGRNLYKNAFAQIDVQLKRRYDLIPNLVETAKAYLKHERETLEAVTAARNQAFAASKQAAADPGEPGAMKSLMGAEAALEGAMGRLLAVMENYPDLKANENMMQLSEDLSSTEGQSGEQRDGLSKLRFKRTCPDGNRTVGLGRHGPSITGRRFRRVFEPVLSVRGRRELQQQPFHRLPLGSPPSRDFRVQRHGVPAIVHYATAL